MAEAGPSTAVLYGIITEHADQGMIRFAHDLDVKKWIDIPRTSVDNLRNNGKNAQGHERVVLTLKTEHAGPVLAAIVAVSLEAVMSLGRKVLAVMSDDGLTPDASTACMNCIKSCKLQLAEDNDPFKQITCMLNCKACP